MVRKLSRLADIEDQYGEVMELEASIGMRAMVEGRTSKVGEGAEEDGKRS